MSHDIARLRSEYFVRATNNELRGAGERVVTSCQFVSPRVDSDGVQRK